jgi:hypothetical protein
MKVRCLLIGVVIIFVAGVLTASSYAKIDPKTCVGICSLRSVVYFVNYAV